MKMAEIEEKIPEKKKKEITRIPSSLSDEHNAVAMNKLYNVTGNIANDIIIYACKNQMQNLFGDVWFSINDFCDKMGYSRTRLQRRLDDDKMKEFFDENPIYSAIDENGAKIYHPIETVFEAALYKLGTTNLGYSEINSKGQTEYKFVQILEGFTIKTNFNTNKKTKRYYRVQISKKFLNTLWNQYNPIELGEYREIPDRTGYRYFYLNLSKMIIMIKHKLRNSQPAHYTLTVDQLAKIFDINVVSNKDRKKKVTSALNSINEYLFATKFKYSYIKSPGAKWAYTVKFEFDQESLTYFDEQFKANFLHTFHETMQDIYLRDVRHIQASEIYKYMKELKSDPDFADWLYSQTDIEKKKNVYQDIFFKIYGKTPQEYGLEYNFDFVL